MSAKWHLRVWKTAHSLVEDAAETETETETGTETGTATGDWDLSLDSGRVAQFARSPQHFGQFYLIRPSNLFIFAAELFYSCLKNITSSSALWRESGIEDNCYGYALIPFRWYIFYCYKTLQKGIVNLVKFATHLRRHLLLYKVGVVSTKDSNLPCLSVHVLVSRNAHKS